MKPLENAKNIFYLALAFFFLVWSLQSIVSLFQKSTLEKISDRLLRENGSLLIKIATHEKVVRSVQKIITPSTPNKTFSEVLLHPLFQNQGKLFLHLIKKLATQKEFQQFIHSSLQRPTSSQHPSDWVVLGKYTLDQLLQKEAGLLVKIIQPLLASTPSSATKKADPIENIGKILVQKLLEKEGALLQKIIQTSLTSLQSQPKKTDPIENIGKYATDKLLEKNALPLQKLIEKIVGPEWMRLTRESRMLIEEIRKQTQTLQLDHLIKTAAYSTSQGAVESFLREKTRNETKQNLQKEIEYFTKNLLHKEFKCFTLLDQNPVSIGSNKLTVQLIFQQDTTCQPMQCLLDKETFTKKLAQQFGKQFSNIQTNLAKPCL